MRGHTAAATGRPVRKRMNLNRDSDTAGGLSAKPRSLYVSWRYELEK
jgi:hypothetical protein